MKQFQGISYNTGLTINNEDMVELIFISVEPKQKLVGSRYVAEYIAETIKGLNELLGNML